MKKKMDAPVILLATGIVIILFVVCYFLTGLLEGVNLIAPG